MTPAEAAEHLRYNRWATMRLLAASGQLPAAQRGAAAPGSFASLGDNLLHVFWVDALWLARLRGEPPPPPPDPARHADAAALQREWGALLEDWLAAITPLDPPGLQRVVRYRNSRGDDCASTVQQIVLHLVNHDSYHRGQIAHRLRALGQAPPSTDLIVFYRGF